MPALEKKSVRDISRVWKSTGYCKRSIAHLFFRLAGLPGRRLRSDKLTSATPNKMASRPLATLAIRGSPNASAERAPDHRNAEEAERGRHGGQSAGHGKGAPVGKPCRQNAVMQKQKGKAPIQIRYPGWIERQRTQQQNGKSEEKLPGCELQG